jgi:hypothetical protein
VFSVACFSPADCLDAFRKRYIGVAEYQLIKSLPKKLKTALPPIEEIEAELSRPPKKIASALRRAKKQNL